MPISTKQWRAAAGSLNAGKGTLRPRPRIKPPFSSPLCGLPSTPPSSWKGYYTVIVLLCVPLLYKMYLVCMAVMMCVVGSQNLAAHGLACGHYCDTSVGLTADVSSSYVLDSGQGGVLFFMLNVVLYVAMVITVLLIGSQDHRGSDKHQWKLTQQIRHLDLFWLNSGPDCEIIFDTNTGSMYATLSTDSKGALQNVRCTRRCMKSNKNIFSSGFAFLGMLSPQFILQLSTLVVAMLLLLAGDVERNPGPISELTIKYHYKVYSYLKDMEDKHLIELGGALGLSYTKLTRMNHLPAEMIAAWLRAEDDVQVTSGPPSWDGLVKALRDIGQAGIASKIKIERENGDTHSACSTRKRPRSSSCHESEESSNKENFTYQTLSLWEPQSASTTESYGIEEDSECPPSDQKQRYSFPYLDLSEITPAERKALEAKLSHEFYEMTEKFEDLKNSITESMKERDVTVTKVVRCISEIAKTLEPFSKDFCKETPKLRYQFDKLQKTTSLDEAMIIMSDYSSFFNYRLVKQIIKRCGTDSDKKRLSAVYTNVPQK